MAEMHPGKILVVRGRDRLYAGWMPAAVGVETLHGPVIRLTPAGLVTRSADGRERLWMKHTTGWPSAAESSVRRHGWPDNAGRYIRPGKPI
jgi:hypothetical protein